MIKVHYFKFSSYAFRGTLGSAGKYVGILLFLIAVCLACLIPASANAQDQLRRLSVEQVSSSRVVVFPDHPYKAGIFIRTSIPRLDIDSNLGIVQDRSTPGTGEYQIIIEPFRQIIYITAPGFQRASFQTGNLNPRDVIFLEIEPEADVDNLISVVFNVSPATADLYIDGQLFPTNETVRVAPGNREIRIESEGYRSISDDISVDERNIQFNYSLEEIDIVPVQIRSTTIGATVTIDGVMRGDIDRSGTRALFLYPGTYTLQLSQSGFNSRSIPIEVTEDGNNQFSIDLTRNVGELELEVTPADARILVNREDYSGRRLIELAPGRYRLEVEKEHFESFAETFDIELNQRVYRSVSLEAHTGTLQFIVSPNDARVELVDGDDRVVNQWTGIQVLRDIQAGSYTLRVSSTGHISKEEPVTIQRGQSTQVSVDLDEGQVETERVMEQRTSVSRPSVQDGTGRRDTQTEVVPITNPVTGRVWMDRNLGASRAATSSTDEQAYGDLYQWGRGADGHQRRNSPTSRTLSSSDQPSHGSFILARNNPRDWRSPQNNDLWQGVNDINNPCPEGFRIPTEAEWNAERRSWIRNNRQGALNSALKLPLAGFRDSSSGSLSFVDSRGYYWSGSMSGVNARGLLFRSRRAVMYSSVRAYGYSVRCIKD